LKSNHEDDGMEHIYKTKFEDIWDSTSHEVLEKFLAEVADRKSTTKLDSHGIIIC
jgi:hypothetical protein